jgi:hypothetical protein
MTAMLIGGLALFIAIGVGALLEASERQEGLRDALHRRAGVARLADDFAGAADPAMGWQPNRPLSGINVEPIEVDLTAA